MDLSVNNQIYNYDYDGNYDTAANAFNGNTLSLTTKLIDQLESEAKIIFFTGQNLDPENLVRLNYKHYNDVDSNFYISDGYNVEYGDNIYEVIKIIQRVKMLFQLIQSIGGLIQIRIQ